MDNVYTQDGSITLKDEETGEWFHNSAGAFLEAYKNYVEPLCLEHWQPQRLKVLDSCFGLGYNSFALLEKLDFKCDVELTCIDKRPENLALMPQVLSQSCFDSIENKKDLLGFFDSVEKRNKKNQSILTSLKSGNINLSINFITGDLRNILPELNENEANFDLVFHDPFSAQKMPELWTKDIFRLYFEMLAPREGRLLTYSTAFAVRGGLSDAGFSVYRTCSVGTKYGGTYALSVSDSILQYGLQTGLIIELTEEEIDKLKGRSGLPYRDPDFNLDRATIFKNRQKKQDEIFQL